MRTGFRECRPDLHVSGGARNRDRTGTTLRSRDFKSLVSTNFTIRAGTAIITTPSNKKGKALRLSLFFDWSGRRVSNSRPQPWQGCALPTELLPQNPGGASRSRTDLHGFAIRCITALLSRRAYLTIGETELLRSQKLLVKSGAGEESRTLDLYLGKVSLYQLSYSRVKRVRIIKT